MVGRLHYFLEDGVIPLDNNAVEQIICPFCVEKKANGLNPFEYFRYLMDQLKEYPRSNVSEDKLAELMPWSPVLPDCSKQRLKK